MFVVNGNPILEDELAVLTELKRQLAVNEIELFNEFVVGNRNIQFNCPVHANGQERKPSCGISIVGHERAPVGTVHCFACGYTATLEEMISHCFAQDDNGMFGRGWLVKNFLTVSVEDRKPIVLNFERGKAKTAPKYVSEQELEKYRFYHDYMYARGLTDDIIELFDVGYDNDFKLKNKAGITTGSFRCLTFPVRDITGGTLFIARRSVDIKFFHYPEGVEKPVYGLYELPEDANEVIVCESFLDALSCYVHGKPAVALLGLGTDYQYEQLKQIKARKLIMALDPDDAGYAATKRIKKAMTGRKLVTEYQLPVGKDVNDLTKKEFDNLLELF